MIVSVQGRFGINYSHQKDITAHFGGRLSASLRVRLPESFDCTPGGEEGWEPAAVKEAGSAGRSRQWGARARARARATAAGPGSDGRGLPPEAAARPQAARALLPIPRVLPEEVPARPDPV